MSLIFSTAQKSEDQIKAEIVQEIKDNLKDYREKYPKECKKREIKEVLPIIESISPEKIEFFAPDKVTRIHSLQFKLTRFYSFISRDGIVGREYMQEPKTLTTEMLGIKQPIYLTDSSSVPKQYGKYFWIPGGYTNFDNCINDSSLVSDIKEKFEEAYREVNAASLYNHPEKTQRINLSDWCILEKEELQDCPGANIYWDIGGDFGKMKIGRYYKTDEEIYLDGVYYLIRRDTYYESGECKEFIGKTPSFLESLIDSIKSLFGK